MPSLCRLIGIGTIFAAACLVHPVMAQTVLPGPGLATAAGNAAANAFAPMAAEAGAIGGGSGGPAASTGGDAAGAPSTPAPVTHFPTAIADGNRMTVTLRVGAGRVVTLAQPATSLFAADPKVAEVRPASPTSIFIFGLAPGRTTIAAMDAGGSPVAQIALTVRASSYGSDEIAGTMRAGLHIPGVDVAATPNGYRVSGHVATPAQAEAVLLAIRPYLNTDQKVDNRLVVDTPLTVNLQVRVIEVQRTVTRQLGINWGASLNHLGGFVTGLSVIDRVVDASNLPDQFGLGYNGSQGGVNAIIDALAQDQLAVVLAEPNLTAQSGESASFLAGGEYPIPIAEQNNTISIDYKQYGVSLAFVPTVLSADRISLKVRPEVSELTTQGAISVSAGGVSLSIPALTVRRAETTVELGSGQSFAIAGLLSDNVTQNARGLPGLGELPILGPLFRSTAFQRGQTELVIVVTPYLVRGVSDPTALVVPTRDMVLSGDLDRILYNRQLARGTAQPAMTHIPLDAGFIAP